MSNMTVAPIENLQVPDAIDWRAEGIFNPVKEAQESCPASWAFAAVSRYFVVIIFSLNESYRIILVC